MCTAAGLIAPPDALATPAIPGVSAADHDLLLDRGRTAEINYRNCMAAGSGATLCWRVCADALENYSAAFRSSGNTDVDPLRAGRALAATCKADIEAAEQRTCTATLDTDQHGSCIYNQAHFNLAARRKRPDLVPDVPPWWDDLAAAEDAYIQARFDAAADGYTRAYDRCERANLTGGKHCLPLLRAVFGSQYQAHAPGRKRLDTSLDLVARALAGSERACKPGMTGELERLCDARRVFLTIRAGLQLDDRQFRGAADDYEDVYDLCKQQGETTTECWRTYGKHALDARMNLLSGAGGDPEQRNLAITLIGVFITDMGVRCEDALTSDIVTAACRTRADLLRPGPVAPVARISPNLLKSALIDCRRRDPTLQACWSDLRAATLDRAELLRSTTDPKLREHIVAVSRDDLTTLLRDTHTDCDELYADTRGHACAHARTGAFGTAVFPLVVGVGGGGPGPGSTTATPPPTTPVTTRSQGTPPRPRPRPHASPPRIAGATLVAGSGVAFILSAVGMGVGRDATGDLERLAADDPLANATDLRVTDAWRRGELGNRLAVGTLVVGAVALVTGATLLAVDARKQRRVRPVAGGLRLYF